MLQEPYRYAHAWPCTSLIQSLTVTHRFDFQVWPQTCLIMMDSSGNCWMVSDPGYCFQTYPDPDLPTQLPGLTSGLIYHQGLVWLSGFLLNLVTTTRPVLLALLGYCGTGHLPVMQLPLPRLVSPLDPASTCYFLTDLIAVFHGLRRGCLEKMVPGSS